MQAVGQQKVVQQLAYVRKFTYLSVAKQNKENSNTWQSVSKKSEKLTPFGGIYFTNRAFNTLSLGRVINETLGKRSSTYNGYQ